MSTGNSFTCIIWKETKLASKKNLSLMEHCPLDGLVGNSFAFSDDDRWNFETEIARKMYYYFNNFALF